MIAQDHLFRLIKSLKPTEKQAFTRYASRKTGEQPLYLRLFHAMNALPNYDEAEFLASPVGAQCSKNFAVQKVELFDKVLQVLRMQRQSGGKAKPIEFRLREYLEDARILREKQLPGLAAKRLHLAMEDATRYELHEIQLELLRDQRRGMMRNISIEDIPKIEAIDDQIATTAAVIQNKARMLQLLDRVYLQAKFQSTLSGRTDHSMLDQMMEAAELRDEAGCQSFEARQNFHFCHALNHQLNKRPREAWASFRHIYMAYRDNPNMQVLKPAEYLNVINNYLGYCINAFEYEDYESALNEMTRGPHHSISEEANATHINLAMKLQKHFSLCEWDKAESVAKQYKDKLETFSEHLSSSRMMLFYLSFSTLKLIQGKWLEAARWAKKVIEEGQGDSQLGMVFQARLQELIALHQLKDIDRVTNRYRSAIRSFQKAKLAGEPEQKILKTIQRLSEQHDEEEIYQTFRSLEKTLAEASPDMQDAISLTSAWVQSHLRRIPLAQVFEEIRDRTIAALPPIP